MDMSLVEGEEKLVDVHGVPDYAEEIHTYLREMEVRSSFTFLHLHSKGLVNPSLLIYAIKCFPSVR